MDIVNIISGMAAILGTLIFTVTAYRLFKAGRMQGGCVSVWFIGLIIFTQLPNFDPISVDLKSFQYSFIGYFLLGFFTLAIWGMLVKRNDNSKTNSQ